MVILFAVKVTGSHTMMFCLTLLPCILLYNFASGNNPEKNCRKRYSQSKF